MASWVPTCWGCVLAGQAPTQYLRLGDVTCGMERPCVADLKVRRLDALALFALLSVD